MSDSGDNLADAREEMVDAAIAEYMCAAGGDEPFAVDEWLARHAGAAGELAEFLRDEGVFGQFAAPLLPPGARAAGPDATTPTADESGPDCTGRSFGDYEILGEIAEGGMGIVYRAWQRQLNRVVALKMVRGERASPREADRLRREAEAVAGLDHPHIVPLYAVGEHDGRPFFAMKLIAGGSLAERLPALAGRYREVAALVAAVARGIDHAHRRGILHRDLKPSNILVDAAGAPHVTDFGLARRLEGGASVSGTVAGTPSYMAPEQARGEKGLTTAVDVYGLGAVLYALLTGGPPFRAESAGEALLLVMTAEPVAPRSADGRVPRDLEAVCLKCLAKDPAARYRSAAALADDLEGWLNGEPVSVRPAGAARRAARWVRRNKGAAALATVTGLLLVTVAGGVWWRQTEKLRQELAEEKRAGEERERLTEERARRTRNAEAAAGSVGVCERALKAGRADRAAAPLAEADRRMPEGGAEELQERLERCRADLAILRSLDEVDNFRWTPVENAFPDRLKLGERWRATFKKFGVIPGETPANETARWMADSLVRERLLTGFDLWLMAEPSPWVRRLLTLADPNEYRESVRDAVAAGNGGRVAELAARPDALTQPAWFAAVLGQIVNVPLGRREVLKVALRVRPGDLTLLMELGGTYPSGQQEGAEERVRWYQAAVTAHPECGAAHVNLGIALKNLGDSDGAIASYLESIRLNPTDAVARVNLGVAWKDRGELDKAITCYLEALRLDPKIAPAHSNLGLALQAKGDLDGAIACYREALRLDPKLASAHDNLAGALYAKGDYDGASVYVKAAVRLDPKLALAHYNLGKLLKDKGDLDGAIACSREAIRLDPKYAPVHNNLGLAVENRGDLDGAIACYREALRLDPKHVPAHSNLGGTLRLRGDVDGAIACCREAIRLDSKYAPAHNNLGLAMENRGDLDGAIACYRESIRLDPKLASAHNNLGNTLRLRGNVGGAIVYFKAAIRLDPKCDSAHYNLGLALQSKGDVDGAIACYRESIRLDPNYPPAHNNLGTAFYSKGELDTAIACFQQAIRLDPKSAMSHDNLGAALKSKGELDGAIACHREAIRLDPVSCAAYSNLGAAHGLKSDLDGAIGYFKVSLRICPRDATVLYNLGITLRSKGDLDGATACFKEAISIERNASYYQSLGQAERWQKLLPGLPDVIAGRARPASPGIACEFAFLCGQSFQKRYVAGVRLYSAAFESDPRFAPSLQFDAARQAVLASAGRDADMIAFGVEEWGELTGWAWAWLRADLRRWVELAKNPEARPAVRGKLTSWKRHPDLAPVRDLAWLAAMPSADRKAWEAFWADVDTVLATAAPTTPNPIPAKP